MRDPQAESGAPPVALSTPCDHQGADFGDRARAAPSRLVILGSPVKHALSPIMQAAALRHAGIPVEYHRLEVVAADLGSVLSGLARERAGGNVTIPHKEAVAARVDHRTAVAERVGAVNTFWVDDGCLIGHNTDVTGASTAIRALVADKADAASDTSVVVLGAGGSAAATLVALHELGFRDIAIVARTAARADALVARIAVDARVVAMTGADDVIARAGLVINATPVGLLDDALPVPVRALRAEAAIFDLVYRPGQTSWVRACRLAGHRAEDGIRMLVEQGAAAFEAWFRIAAPRDAMWSAVGAVPPVYGRISS